MASAMQCEISDGEILKYVQSFATIVKYGKNN